MNDTFNNKRIKNLMDKGICFACMKCCKKNCYGNEYIKNKKLYKKLTGDNL